VAWSFHGDPPSPGVSPYAPALRKRGRKNDVGRSKRADIPG
jgi:hypothetical protein